MTETREQSRGTCQFCGSSYAKGGMSRHLQACAKRQEAIDKETKGRAKPRKIFHIVAEGQYIPDFWLHLEAPENMKLEALDGFLRDIWLECCGHLSQFIIDGQHYSVSPMAEFGDRSMNTTLARVLDSETVFQHEYDFGSTTHLKLRVAGVRDGVMQAKVRLLARNDPPDIMCENCGQKPATLVCTFCIWNEPGAWVCDSCKEQHSCYVEEGGDDYMFLPVVNSPRVGTCAYGAGSYGY